MGCKAKKAISYMHKLGLLTFYAAALSGCGAVSDPSTETPVEVTAGMYHLSNNGNFAGINMPQAQGPGDLKKDFCVLPGQEAAFPKMVAGYFSLHEACTFQPGQRTGNAISGVFICPTDPERAPGGSMTSRYTGSIAADQVQLTGQVTMNLPSTPALTEEESAQLQQARKMMDAIKIVITAKRTGDCNAATPPPAIAPAETMAPETVPTVNVPENEFGEPTSFGEPTTQLESQ
jgi:hypothetical protein